MYNILITGSNGQLGSELQEESIHFSQNNSHFFFTNRDTLDITNKEEIRQFIDKNKINFIINCAAYTAVDEAENDIDTAKLINHISVKILANLAKKRNIKLIHISTDYVFDGTKYLPYIEKDTTNPNGIYGATKLAGEKDMLSINPINSLIIRTSWVYSSYGKNFVKTMLKLGKEREKLNIIFDQIGTPTYANDLAKAILEILPQLDNQNVEVYHYSNEGVCSWYDFAQTIFEIKDITCQILPIETKEYPTDAKRPHYSLLNKKKIKETFNIEIPYWKQSLEKCLQKL